MGRTTKLASQLTVGSHILHEGRRLIVDHVEQHQGSVILRSGTTTVTRRVADYVIVETPDTPTQHR